MSLSPATTSVFSAMQERVPQLALDRDEWTLHMMRWHFSEATGSPFWLARKASLGFDPLRDVTDFDALLRFGTFDKRALRSARVRDLIPRGFSGRPFRVLETGGTTGAPCRVVDFTRTSYDVEIFDAMLDCRGVRKGDVLALTPGGPHAYGHFVERLARGWGGVTFTIDFDPRWARSRAARSALDAEGYIEHLVEQAKTILRTQPIAVLFTTTRLLQGLVERLGRPLESFGIETVCTGGTGCTREEERYLRDNYLQGLDWIDTYGNTLMGHALQADPLEPGATRSYHLPPPFGHVRVVSDEDWSLEVEVGERGRVMIVTLLEDLFIPNLLERDSAIRAGPHLWFPWDGVAEVGPHDAQTVPDGSIY